ncbi:hypothetical protein RFI_12312 [Reticulomyxa filosa]|uniref:Enoyl-CoA hydratase/isomerase family protein n=1 Tax=Reticulomyxa filosa TaxID=46433 RepID=X6NFV7_RETFI|nr:hypothetical protein RFI_12312 [Reticulomyxa filosa]|eukprot:ETO24846.1 hypothetical protein RFI_12312 [Reticulomyxa filosa]
MTTKKKRTLHFLEKYIYSMKLNRFFGDITLYTSKNKKNIVLQLHSGKKKENVFNDQLIKEINQALDYITENLTERQVLIVTGSHECSYFSLGLDVKQMNFKEKDHQKRIDYLSEQMCSIFDRLLLMDCVTIAAINGHCFGAGIFFALACDWRFAYENSSASMDHRICFPEIRLNLNVGDGWKELMQSKLPSDTVRTAILTGKHWSMADALAGKIVDRIIKDCVSFEDFILKIQTLCEIPKNGIVFDHKTFNNKNYRRLKMDLYGHAHSALFFNFIGFLIICCFIFCIFKFNFLIILDLQYYKGKIKICLLWKKVMCVGKHVRE